MSKEASEPVRPSPIAGTWYPGTVAELSRDVVRLLDDAQPGSLAGDLVALVSPHAGLRYSGPVAAAGYRLLRETGALDAAIIVGPSHRFSFEGTAIFPSGAFETPLGRVSVDGGLAESLQAIESSVKPHQGVHEQEHCLEMQLPFLQVLVPGLSIVPLLMGEQTRNNVNRLASALARVVEESGRRVLLIASSDLSHYHEASHAGQMDRQVVDCVERLAPAELMKLLERRSEHACGGGAIVSVLEAARALGAQEARVVSYGDSGDITGDKSSVVGYLSAAAFQTRQDA